MNIEEFSILVSSSTLTLRSQVTEAGLKTMHLKAVKVKQRHRKKITKTSRWTEGFQLRPALYVPCEKLLPGAESDLNDTPPQVFGLFGLYVLRNTDCKHPDEQRNNTADLSVRVHGSGFYIAS